MPECGGRGWPTTRSTARQTGTAKHTGTTVCKNIQLRRSQNAKLEVDRALDTANKTLHRLLKEISFESEADTKAAALNSIRDKRLYTEVYESEADAKVIRGKWVLKPHKARYVLRGFEEDAKDEDVFDSTTMTASVRMLLSQATDLRNEGCTVCVFTADVKRLFSMHT